MSKRLKRRYLQFCAPVGKPVGKSSLLPDELGAVIDVHAAQLLLPFTADTRYSPCTALKSCGSPQCHLCKGVL